jgi:TatD DNase family protein
VGAHIDSHAHLCHKAFRDDLPSVLARARDKGVFPIVNVAVDPETSRATVETSERHEGLLATVGIHPHEAAKMTERALRELRALSSSGAVVAIGESGLDFYRMLAPRWCQEECFRKCVRLAIRQDLPLVIHCRDAELEVLDVVREFRVGLQGRVVYHCFSSLPDYARRFVDEGCYLGFAGNVTYWDQDRLRRTVTHASLDRIFVETDSPYLSPEPQRGDRNEPANVALVVSRLARAFQRPVDELASKLTANAEHFFGIGAKGEP